MDGLVAVLRRHCRVESANVLVIDDDEPSRALMRRGLEAAGHVVTAASDGKAGIEAMEAEPPDLVVLDLMMPVLDGFAVVEHMRASESLRRVPIVVVTAKDLSSEDRAMLRGARAILERSDYNRQELLDAVVERVAELAAD
jgi:CheY-like chemotaxis protein